MGKTVGLPRLFERWSSTKELPQVNFYFVEVIERAKTDSSRLRNAPSPKVMVFPLILEVTKRLICFLLLNGATSSLFVGNPNPRDESISFE